MKYESAAEVAALIETLVERLSQVLAGQPPTVQGAALAECIAIFIRGHIVLGNDPAQTRQWREKVFELHQKMVRQLMEIEVE